MRRATSAAAIDVARPVVLAIMCGLGFGAAPARAQPAERVEATLWHFNLQYVAGGMIGFPDFKSTAPDFTLTETEVEDAIVVESFAPLLDIYERHPTWKANLELQGLFIHP